MIGENIILLVGIPLLTALLTIIILQRNYLRSTKLEYEQEILELAEKHKTDSKNFDDYIEQKFETFSINQECSFLTHTIFLLQIVFGIVVLAGFSWWTVYLIKAGMIPWALLTAIFAILGLVLPFLVWKAINRRSEAWERLKEGTEQYSELAAAEPELHQPAPVVQEKVAVVEEKPEIVAPEPAPAPEAAPEPVQETPPVPVQKARPAVLETAPVVVRKPGIPEDSMLKRHFLSRMRAEIESRYHTRPTDSMLCRHFQAMIDGALEERLAGMNG